MRILCEEFLRYEMQPTMGAGGMGTEVDTFAHFAVTYENVETGEIVVDKVVRLA